MAQIVIDIPDGADMKTRLAALRRKLAEVNMERDAILGAIKSIQRSCGHPNAIRGRDISGCSEMYCPDCEYSD